MNQIASHDHIKKTPYSLKRCRSHGPISIDKKEINIYLSDEKWFQISLFTGKVSFDPKKERGIETSSKLNNTGKGAKKFRINTGLTEKGRLERED